MVVPEQREEADMRAAVVRDFHRPIAVEDVPVPSIGRDEVLVKIEPTADQTKQAPQDASARLTSVRTAPLAASTSTSS